MRFTKLCILLWVVLLLSVLAGTLTAPVFAADTTYVVLNFSEMNKLNWAADEAHWNQEIKPRVMKQLKHLMTLEKGPTKRKLAWSTLMEFMNIPLDTPSEKSAYAVKLRRILDLSEELNLPVFVPFNTFQWWDELPELYNWWDPDGTHTSEVFFKRQTSADFKRRFVAGYNPENKWNVDWQDYQTPMELNWRNWGSGGFRLAPPPNIARHARTAKTYRSVLDARMAVLLAILSERVAAWEKQGKGLFAGMSIGTELSLNASVTPADEFMPYGYRAIQDTICDKETPVCGKQKNLSKKDLEAARNAVLTEFLTDYTYQAVQHGIPKDSIYTHVWGDTTPDEKKYAPYALSSFNLYSNPGMSFYGTAQKPLDLAIFQSLLMKYRYPTWGAVEYNLPPEYNTWMQGLTNTLDNGRAPAGVVVIYNWDQIHDTPAIRAVSDFLKKPALKPDCTVPRLIPSTPNRALDPKHLTWTLMADGAATPSSLIIRIQSGSHASLDRPDKDTFSVTTTTRDRPVDDRLHGIFTWFSDVQACDGKSYFSEPRILVLTDKEKPRHIPFYVRLANEAIRLYRKLTTRQ